MKSLPSERPSKRRRILDAAAALYAAEGVEGTTLAMIARSSGAAVGSITHFFGDKSQVAAAVHDRIARGLAAVAEGALRNHPSDVGAAIQALLSDLLTWREEHPAFPRLLGVLIPYTHLKGGMSIEKPSCRMGQILASWAEPLVQAGKLASLSPSQLYAVVLSPAMSAARSDDELLPPKLVSSIDWLKLLSRIAVTGISRCDDDGGHVPSDLPSGPKARRPSSARLDRRKEQSVLFSLPSARPSANRN